MELFVKIKSAISAILLVASFFATTTGCKEDVEDPLTQEERAWLNEHDGTIRISPCFTYPPFDFIDKDKSWKGVTADIFRVIEKRLNFRVKMVYIENWSETVEAAKNGDTDILTSNQNTPERREFLRFTDPFISVPNVIIVKKDIDTPLTLKELSGKRVAIVKGYTVSEFVKKKNPSINIVYMKDDIKGLQMVSFGQVDAFIADTGVASYYIEKFGISNLKVAGDVGFDYNLCFSSRKELLLLNSILQKGLSLVTQEERESIHDKWIHLGVKPFYKTRGFWFIIIGLFGIASLVILIILLWSRTLKHQVEQRTAKLDKANKQLRESEDRFRTLVENVPGVTYRTACDENWTMEFISAEVERLSGYPASDFLQNKVRSYASIIHPEDQQMIANIVMEGVENKEPYIIEYRIVCADGMIKWVFEKGQVLFSNNGQLIFLDGVIIDITVRKQAEVELHHLRNYLSNIIDSMPSVLVGVDADGKVTQWNKTTEQTTGIAAVDAQGKILSDVLPQMASEMRKITESIQTREPIIKQKKSYQSEKGTRYEDVTIYPLIANGVEGAVIRVDDVTEEFTIQEQLRQAQKMETVGTLAGGLAHDFNNVLGGIIGTLSILQYKVQSPKGISQELLEEYLQTMNESGMRATDMVQQLLTLSRKQEFSFGPIDLNMSLKHVLKICKNTFDKSIELNFSFYQKRAVVNADQTQIEQVLLNLCVNASHAMTTMREEGIHKGGTLSVSIDQNKADKHFCKTHSDAEEIEYWKISVEDTGIGMDKKTIAKIFDPFFTTKEKGMGTGLGLAMVYSIVKQHNGFIDIYSEEAEGTTFNVYIPALQRDLDDAYIKGKAEDVPKGSGLILIVDDEEVMIKIAKKMLEECGFNIITAKNGEEGIEKYLKHRDEIVAILLDLVMPKKSGEEAYNELLQIDKEVKVLLSSGFRKDKRVDNLLEMGVQGFVQKPYTIEKLAKAVHDVLNRRKNK